MTTDSSKPLDGVEPESVSPADVDETEVRAALTSSNPMVKQRGAAVCETLAATDVDAVRPFLDDVAALADDDNAAIALRAIATLDEVVEADPAALEDRLSELAGAAASDVVDVQLTAATAFGKLVVSRPDLVAPYAGRLVEAVRVTEPDAEPENYGDLVDDRVTRRTIEEHVAEERKRRVSGRRTLVNVVVAVSEEEPQSALAGDEPNRSGRETELHDVRRTESDAAHQRPSVSEDIVGGLVALLDDVDPGVAGGAVDALGELAAANPEAVAPAADGLLDCLDHDRTFVRARAVRALGHLGDEANASDLRRVAEHDDDEDVRELAARTADFLADDP